VEEYSYFAEPQESELLIKDDRQPLLTRYKKEGEKLEGPRVLTLLPKIRATVSSE
jgi:hypothetical protein